MYVLPPDAASDSEAESIAVTFNAVAGAYFRTLSIDVLEGRGLEGSNTPGAPPVAVVSRELRTMLFGDGEAVGQQLVLGPWPDQPRRIVGVVEGVAQGGFTGPPVPAVYLPYGQAEGQLLPHMYVIARGAHPPDSVAADLKAVIMGIEPGIAPSDLSSLESRLGRVERPWAAATSVTNLLGLLALGLALSGVYAATSGFVVAQAREAGVRSALGAGPLSLIWFLSRRGAVCLVAALPFGLLGGLAAVRVARMALPGVEGPGSEAALIVCGAVLLSAGMAILRPAWSTVRRNAMGLIQHGLSGRSA